MDVEGDAEGNVVDVDVDDSSAFRSGSFRISDKPPASGRWGITSCPAGTVEARATGTAVFTLFSACGIS